ncbi:TPA: hypothetical protein U5E40_003554 [Yersinia enterocolitica]|nr:hypothetical protein [Yersinia enterocolitica]
MFFHNKNKINLKKDSLSEAIEKKTSNKKISDKTFAKILKKTILLLETIENQSGNSLWLNNSSLELMALEITQHIRNMTINTFTSTVILRNLHSTITPQRWISLAVPHYMREAPAMTMLKTLIIQHYILNELDKSISLLDNPIHRSPEPKFVFLLESFQNIRHYVNERIRALNERYIAYLKISDIGQNQHYNLTQIVSVATNALDEKLTSLTREAFRVSDIKLIPRNLEEYEAFPSEINTYIDKIRRLTRTVMTQTPTVMTQTPTVTTQTRTVTPQTHSVTPQLSHRLTRMLDKIQDEMTILEERKDRSRLEISEGGIQPGGRLIVYKIDGDFLTEKECKEKNIHFHDGITLKYINEGEYLAECNKLSQQYKSCV